MSEQEQIRLLSEYKRLKTKGIRKWTEADCDRVEFIIAKLKAAGVLP